MVLKIKVLSDLIVNESQRLLAVLANFIILPLCRTKI